MWRHSVEATGGIESIDPCQLRFGAGDCWGTADWGEVSGVAAPPEAAGDRD